jgi:ABC-2 type transport system ATP-binding protein
MAIIAARHLHKTFRTKVKAEGFSGSMRSLFKPRFKTVEAVRDISFTVEKGEVLAFIGPNGAGKSTTIKMLTGILFPTSGEIEVLGLNPSIHRMELSFKIGSVFGQKSQLWFHLPPADSFKLLGSIFEIPRRELEKRIAFLRELFELEDLMDTPVRKLSLGQRIRCEIAASLLHNPEIIFLDEPTIGLDVVVKQKIRDLIKKLNKEEGVTIFLTSHDIGDIERICKRAVIINNGEIVLDESIKNLKYNYLKKKVIDVKYGEKVDFRIDVPSITVVKATDYSAKIEVDTTSGTIKEAVGILMGLGNVQDINISDQPLEEIISDIYRMNVNKEVIG